MSLKEALSKTTVMGIIAISIIIIYLITLSVALLEGIITGDDYIKSVSPLAIAIVSFYYGAKVVKSAS